MNSYLNEFGFFVVVLESGDKKFDKLLFCFARWNCIIGEEHIFIRIVN